MHDQKRGVAVLSEIVKWATDSQRWTLQSCENGVSILRSPTGREIECVVFQDHAEIIARFEKGLSPKSAVVLFDRSGMGRKSWRPTTATRSDDVKLFPFWTYGAEWAVQIGEACFGKRFESCARQLFADFVRCFEERLEHQWFPWGAPRKNEAAPSDIKLPAHIEIIVSALNSGPDLHKAIAHQQYAMELPPDSRISWLRVPSDPLECDEDEVRRIMFAFRRLEEASRLLLAAQPSVRDLLLTGVDLDPRFHDLYLYPPQTSFSVRRPDLHWTGIGQSKVFASENDEMPGGFPELVHVDFAYGLNQERWTRCFNWLTSLGPLLFVVSHEWSKCYVPEIQWLVERLVARGYAARILTTDRLHELTISDSGVYHNGEKVGTIWRQFPIFETNDALAALVTAAHKGIVRMVPEFAYYGNKVLFSLYRSHHSFFAGVLEPAVISTLDDLLPNSNLVLSESSFPLRAGGMFIASLTELSVLSQDIRDGLVLKICGANALAARSKGVLMGNGIRADEWSDWVFERIKLRQPFLVQRRIQTAVAHIPVQHTKRNCPELFHCRVLVRPWEVGGEIVSASGCAVPSSTERVHGRVDMAVCAIRFVRSDASV